MVQQMPWSQWPEEQAASAVHAWPSSALSALFSDFGLEPQLVPSATPPSHTTTETSTEACRQIARIAPPP